MNGNEYQYLAMRTNDGSSTERLEHVIQWLGGVQEAPIWVGDLLNGCLGLAGESGEFCDLVKKWVFHEKALDEEHMKKELGDVMWYVALICHSMKWNLADVMQMNVDKLKARYPDDFDVVMSANRKEGDV